MSGGNDPLFWAKVDKTETCWLWTGALNHAGYGVLRRWAGGKGKNHLAHRYSLTLAGARLGREIVDHICFTPNCVRPDHLRLVTNKQNHEHLRGPNTNNKSGYRGVHRDAARERWTATVKHNYRSYSKRFDSDKDAAEWARLKRIELFTHNDLDRVA